MGGFFVKPCGDDHSHCVLATGETFSSLGEVGCHDCGSLYDDARVKEMSLVEVRNTIGIVPFLVGKQAV